MTAQAKRTWTVEDYLAFERSSELKHEYFGGEIFAMAGASAAHNIITANIVASLHRQVFERNCTVSPSDMRLKVVQHDLYTYPDVTVVCGNVHYEDDEQDILLNPTVIIEVLSPSTENYDRGKKSHYYRTIPSLQEYLLVSQDGQHVEHFIRYSEHQWLFSEVTNEGEVVQITSIDCALALVDIYNKVPRRQEE